MKTKFARYLSQLGRFGRESISKHSGSTATNSEQTSFSRSLTRGKMCMKCGRVYEKHHHERTQNTPTVNKKRPTWCGSNATNSDQSKGFAPSFFRGWRHRAKSPPRASSNSLLFVVFASLFEHIKQYDWEGKCAVSTWNTEQTASSDPVDGNRPMTKTSLSYVNSRLNYISPENRHSSKYVK